MNQINLARLAQFLGSGALCLTISACPTRIAAPDRPAQVQSSDKASRIKATRSKCNPDSRQTRKLEMIVGKLKKIISVVQTPEQMARILTRLADTYLDLAALNAQIAYGLEDCLQGQNIAPKERAATEELISQKQEQERTYRLEAIKVLQRLISHHPDSPRSDEHLYLAAATLHDLKRSADALRLHTQLIKAYPDSKFVPDSYLALGEYYFDQAQIDRAIKLYQKVAQYKDSAVRDYAIYKTAWCWYNLQDYRKAADHFAQIILHTQDSKNKSLRAEALKDFVLTWSHFGQPQDAQAAFSRLSPDATQTAKMIRRLADLWADQGKADLAQALEQLHPKS